MNHIRLFPHCPQLEVMHLNDGFNTENEEATLLAESSHFSLLDICLGSVNYAECLSVSISHVSGANPL